MHDYIIILIIVLIIGLQFFIFGQNISKIKKYKQTIEDVNDFEIVEVSVPEEWIKEIGVEEILQNPEKFQELSMNFSSTMEETDEDPNAFYDQEEQNLGYNLIEDEEDQTYSHKKNEQVQEIDFPENEESFEIEEFEEEDFEDYKTNR